MVDERYVNESNREEKEKFYNNFSHFNLIEDNDSDFADMTLVCDDGPQLKAHKVILDGSRHKTTTNTHWSKPEDFIPTLFTRGQRTTLVYAKEFSPESIEIEKSVERQCNRVNNKNSFQGLWSASTLYKFTDLPMNPRLNWYESF